jgi:plasmid rolling circle replication initiator protein Rep
MRNELAVSDFEGRPLNTLVQSGTPQPKKINLKRPKMVAGMGIEVTNTEGLMNRAKRKMLSQKMSLKLVDIANKKGEPERARSYWNTFHCQRKLTSANGRIYGKFCKNRFCTVCCSIRKAEIMNSYLSTIKTWEEPYFVTLTAKSVKAHQLKQRVDDMLRAFKIIVQKNKKRNQRGKGIKLIGIKSLECNFNPQKQIYNPHLHFIVPNKEVADLLISEWCKLWTPKFANPGAQKAKKVWDKENALIEIVKYSTKIFTDPNMAKKGKVTAPPYIYLSALDTIVAALQGHRIFDRFGFNLPKKNKPTRKQTVLTDYSELKYDSKKFDWVKNDTDEVLTGYIAPSKLLAILELNVNITLQ